MAELLEASEPKKCRLASAEGNPPSKIGQACRQDVARTG